jgi:hypothetical protein
VLAVEARQTIDQNHKKEVGEEREHLNVSASNHGRSSTTQPDTETRESVKKECTDALKEIKTKHQGGNHASIQ